MQETVCNLSEVMIYII